MDILTRNYNILPLNKPTKENIMLFNLSMMFIIIIMILIIIYLIFYSNTYKIKINIS